MEKILKNSSYLAIFAGIVLLIGGIWGIYFTFKNVAKENITTPSDASIPETKVRGPFTLLSQAEVIREHTLKITGNKTYAEMPRTINKTDGEGKEILGKEGKPIQIPNDARNIWITATTLITALHLGVLTYVFSSLIILFGFISIWTGIIFLKMAKL